MFEEESPLIAELINGLPLSDQLQQKLDEARKCRDLKLPIATIATLSIAMETACKVVLENHSISYNRGKDGLNELLNKLVHHELLTEKNRQAALSLKGMRNSVIHGHNGLTSEDNGRMFFTCGDGIITEILKSVKHKGSS